MPKLNNDMRAQIINAAHRILAEQGYDATTIKAIAQAAGVAPGLVHYYFANKEALLIAVLKEASTQYTQAMQQLPAASDSQLAEAGLAEPRRRVTQQPAWYRLRYELFALGLRNHALEQGTSDLLANGRAGIRTLIERLTPGERDPQQDEALAAILLACFDGLALQQLVDPTFNLDRAYALLLQMSRTVLNQR